MSNELSKQEVHEQADKLADDIEKNNKESAKNLLDGIYSPSSRDKVIEETKKIIENEDKAGSLTTNKEGFNLWGSYNHVEFRKADNQWGSADFTWDKPASAEQIKQQQELSNAVWESAQKIANNNSPEKKK